MTTSIELLEVAKEHFEGRNLERVTAALQSEHAEKLVDRLADNNISAENYIKSLAETGENAGKQTDMIVTDLVTGTFEKDIVNYEKVSGAKDALQTYREKAMKLFDECQTAVKKLIAADAPAAVAGEFAKKFHDTAPTYGDLGKFVREHQNVVDNIELAVAEGHAAPAELFQAQKKLQAAESIRRNVGDRLNNSVELEKYMDSLAKKAERVGENFAPESEKLYEMQGELRDKVKSVNKARERVGKTVKSLKDHLPDEIHLDSLMTDIEQEGLSASKATKTTGRYAGQLKRDLAGHGKHFSHTHKAETVADAAKKEAKTILGFKRSHVAIGAAVLAGAAFLLGMGGGDRGAERA